MNRREFGKLIAGTSLMAGMMPGLALASDTTELNVAVEALWHNIAPINGISNASIRIFPNIYDRLVEIDYLNDPSGQTLIPRLATGWERDGKVWTITLREGVKFHNGETMTAEDVAFTLSAERLWGDEPYEPRGRTYTAGFVRVEATGPLTVEIETADEDINIPGKLSGFIGYVVPKAYYLETGVEGFGQAPVGTGPYRMVNYRGNEAARLEAFADHWNGAPPVERLNFLLVPEYAGRLAGLATGEFDIIASIPIDQENQIETMEGATLIRKQVNNYTAVLFNTRNDPEGNPLQDQNLRYAMIQAIDMDAIVQALFSGNTFFPAVPFNFPEYGNFHDAAAKPRLPYDLEAARALVAKSGYKGETLIWHITRGFWTNYDAAAEIMVEMWREAGINVEAQFLDNFQLAYERPFHMLAVSGGTSFIPGDPYQPLWLDWSPTGVISSASWKTWDPTERFVEIGTAYAKSTDPDERKALFLELSEEWQRVTPGQYMWKSLANWAVRDGISFVPVPEFEMRMHAGYLTL
ncbi:ABC transporter substrate-binding protein [Nitratireductor pacificus]|uniref:Family 5 extracellular solute-binding protein n=1 Tax=Nitratireductor pacificus pht-3B TaxID=391937 RepID=K2N8U7_9HYPH|nr:ABC transporter substrate-binding protein [Nitratireductor pacificus]EKF20528.1 family 5 extracellular solute-binding protein [Nitratireductor pacificus pht-3B]